MRDDFEWRGLGPIPHSGYRIADAFADWDAENRFEVPGARIEDPKACRCGDVLRGMAKPFECSVFGTACTPEKPLGTCMVSSEGACAAYYAYGRAPAEGRRVSDDVITLAHGAGGKASRRLVEELFLVELRNPLLEPLADAALVSANGTRLAFTTDSYVVRPLVFPGGDIGELAVNGTVNDLAVSGSTPLALTAGFVIEEGFPMDELRALARSAARAADGRRRVDRRRATRRWSSAAPPTACTSQPRASGSSTRACQLDPSRVRPGDRVLVSGGIAEHGIAVMIARGNLELELDVDSDTAPLHEIAAALCGLGADLRWMRDPTRGGLATTLNELAAGAGMSVVLDEAAIPVRDDVRSACELLGIDPLYVANEGKLVAVVAPEAADAALELLRAHPLGAGAALIGEVCADDLPLVLAETPFGGSRIVDMLVGDPLPRIC